MKRIATFCQLNPNHDSMIYPHKGLETRSFIASSSESVMLSLLISNLRYSWLFSLCFINRKLLHLLDTLLLLETGYVPIIQKHLNHIYQ